MSTRRTALRLSLGDAAMITPQLMADLLGVQRPVFLSWARERGLVKRLPAEFGVANPLRVRVGDVHAAIEMDSTCGTYPDAPNARRGGPVTTYTLAKL